MKITYFIIFLVILLVVSGSSDPRCLNHNGEDVKWWLILKVRGFTDVYLYYDSNMEKDTVPEMMVGYHLRMDSSPLGKTMMQFFKTNDDKEIEHVDDLVYFAYNDHGLHFNEKTRQYFVDKSFYNSGAHEKGFIGWKNNGNEKKGIIIQHSLPKWPIRVVGDLDDPGAFKPPYTQFEDDIKTTYPECKEDDKKRLSPFFGWKNSFFGTNLLAYRPNSYPTKPIGDREGLYYQVIQEDQKDYLEVSYPKRYAPLDHMDNSRLRYILSRFVSFGKDFNPYARLLSNSKPTQHIFCSNVDDLKVFREILDLLTNLGKSKKLLVYILQHKDDELISENVQLVDKVNVKDAIEDVIKVEDNKEGNDGIGISGGDTIKEDEKGFVLQFNDVLKVYGSRNKLGNSHVWMELFEKPFHLPKSGDPIFISTWSSTNKGTFNDMGGTFKHTPKFISPTISIGEFSDKITWQGFSNKEHSKIAFKEIGDTNDEWNVCVSGGNLYLKEKTNIHGSLIMCFKALNLREILLNMVEKSVNTPKEESVTTPKEEPVTTPKKKSSKKKLPSQSIRNLSVQLSKYSKLISPPVKNYIQWTVSNAESSLITRTVDTPYSNHKVRTGKKTEQAKSSTLLPKPKFSLYFGKEDLPEEKSSSYDLTTIKDPKVQTRRAKNLVIKYLEGMIRCSELAKFDKLKTKDEFIEPPTPEKISEKRVIIERVNYMAQPDESDSEFEN